MNGLRIADCGLRIVPGEVDGRIADLPIADRGLRIADCGLSRAKMMGGLWIVQSKVEGRIAELKISDFPVSGFVKLRGKTRFAPPCRDSATPQSAIRNPQSAIDRAFRPGYTLIELVLAMAITGILLAGMSASIVIASRTVSDGYDVVGLALRTSDVLGEVNSDLSTAEDFLDRTSSSVTFTVPDRDGDGVSETIKYWWTGESDGRLMRQVNDGPEVALAENVRQFALTYGLTTMAAEQQSDSDDGGKIWHGRKRRPRWGWYWDHRGNAWGHYDYKPGNGNGNNNGNGNGKK